MDKDKKKKIDDEFKKSVIDILPDFVPDKNKMDIADICSDVVDLLEDRQTNNTIVALELLGKYYKGMMFSKLPTEFLDNVVKELNELSDKLKEDEPSNHSETIH